jgi:hypothetical protein
MLDGVLDELGNAVDAEQFHYTVAMKFDSPR